MTKSNRKRNFVWVAGFLIVTAIASGLAAFLVRSNRKGDATTTNGSNSLRATVNSNLNSSSTPTASQFQNVSNATIATTTNITATAPDDDLPQQSNTTAAMTTTTPSAKSPTVAPSKAPTTKAPSTKAPISSTSRPTSNRPTMSTVAADQTNASPARSPSFDAPTFPPVEFPAFDEQATTFRLKMYWQEGFFWQEETQERFWCIECTKCDTLNFSADGAGCEDAWDCEAGHQLWVRGCDKGYGHVFEAVRVAANANDNEPYYHQIKVHDTNLCLERTQKRYLTVQECSANNNAQLWHQIRADGGPFELRPANGQADDVPYCVTQPHHPKPWEILGLQECQQAHRYETGYWNTFPLYSNNDDGDI